MRFIDYANSSIFAAPSRGPLLFGTMPGFGPEILWDFTNPAAPLPGFSLTRATTGTFVAQDGTIQTAAINAPRYDWTGGVRALLVEPSATNKCTAYAAPTDTTNVVKSGDVAAVLSVTDDAAALAAAGLSAITGAKAYLLDNTTGVANAWLNIAGPCGNTATHYLSAYARSTGAVATALGIGGSMSGAVNLTSSYSMVKFSTAGVVGGTMYIRVPAGSKVWLVLPQLEEGAYTSYIPTAGAAVTRAADSLASLAMSAIWAAAGSVQGTIVVDVEAGAPNSITRGHLWSIDDAGNDALAARAYLTGSSDDRAVLSAGNGTTNSDLLITAALRGRQKVAVSYANGAQPLVSRNGGAPQVHPLVYAHNPANNALQNLFANFNGRVRSLAVYRNAASAAQLQQMSVAA